MIKGILPLIGLLVFSQILSAKPIGDKRFLIDPRASFVFALDENPADFEAIVSIPGCSGSIIRYEGQSEGQKAILLTNDHCIYDQPFNEFIVDQNYNSRVNVYNKNREVISDEVRAEKIIYAVQTDTDMALLQLDITYRELKDKYDIEPFTLSKEGVGSESEITIVSGYWNKRYDCSITDIGYKLQEDTWFWTESYGYYCGTIGGTSGSPIIVRDSRIVVGVNNTGNENGGRCTINNPCEIDEQDQVTVVQGKDYGQQTKYVYTCLNDDFDIDLSLESCQLLGGAGYGMNPSISITANR